jgi:hypothetical protein
MGRLVGWWVVVGYSLVIIIDAQCQHRLQEAEPP